MPTNSIRSLGERDNDTTRALQWAYHKMWGEVESHLFREHPKAKQNGGFTWSHLSLLAQVKPSKMQLYTAVKTSVSSSYRNDSLSLRMGNVFK